MYKKAQSVLHLLMLLMLLLATFGCFYLFFKTNETANIITTTSFATMAIVFNLTIALNFGKWAEIIPTCVNQFAICLLLIIQLMDIANAGTVLQWVLAPIISGAATVTTIYEIVRDPKKNYL